MLLFRSTAERAPLLGITGECKTEEGQGELYGRVFVEDLDGDPGVWET